MVPLQAKYCYRHGLSFRVIADSPTTKNSFKACRIHNSDWKKREYSLTWSKHLRNPHSPSRPFIMFQVAVLRSPCHEAGDGVPLAYIEDSFKILIQGKVQIKVIPIQQANTIYLICSNLGQKTTLADA